MTHADLTRAKVKRVLMKRLGFSIPVICRDEDDERPLANWYNRMDDETATNDTLGYPK